MNNNKIWKLSPAYRLVDTDDENKVVNGDDEYDDIEDSMELESLFESLDRICQIFLSMSNSNQSSR
jgi:hypothetical protein